MLFLMSPQVSWALEAQSTTHHNTEEGHKTRHEHVRTPSSPVYIYEINKWLNWKPFRGWPMDNQINY